MWIILNSSLRRFIWVEELSIKCSEILVINCISWQLYVVHVTLNREVMMYNLYLSPRNVWVYRAIGNYCDAGSTLFGAEISISHKFCFFKNFCLGYDLSDNMKHFFCVMNFWPQKGLRRQRGWDSKSSQAIYSSNP